jgi:osmoprotectant transport system permease protein
VKLQGRGVRRWLAVALGVLECVLSRPGGAARAATPVLIGSKQFTESVVLGELATALVRASGSSAQHHSQLGGTQVLWQALVQGQIDLYPEYTGTLEQEILKGEGVKGEAALRQALASYGVLMSRSLGFNDTYALGMKAARAQALGIRSISDLRRHPELRLGFTNEFMDRADGWPGLRARYALPQHDVRGLDHDLAYRGLDADTIDVTDLYSTDADIAYYHIQILEDDQHYFPVYDAVWLMRTDLRARAPAALVALARLEGKIDAGAMAGMNARAKIQRVPEARVAADFLSATLGVAVESEEPGRAARILHRTEEHLALVTVSLSAALCVALPLGILAARRPRLGAVVLAGTGVLQTIPSLALLVFMIPFLGIGGPPAVAALFLYSLLPIVRNTHAGLTGIPAPLRESAEALGLSRGARLWHVELPLASPSILAGVKTSAVINVGTATLGAIIGAGGYGQPILTGIRLDNVALILEGAVPAALLAVGVQALFAGAERWVVPLGLRLTHRD